jgi:acyl-CoA synthetase (AMP-forming)/AMP-acid ligase II
MIVAARPPDRKTIETNVSAGSWGTSTFADLLEARAAEHPDREVMSDARRRITYGRLWDEVRRCATVLRRHGVRRGDVVAVQLPNRIEFAVVFFALELIGAIGNMVNLDFRALELEPVLRVSAARAYVCGASARGFDLVALVRDLRRRLPALVAVLCVDPLDQPGGTSIAAELVAAPPLPDLERVRMSPDEPMRMCFTSGTTGAPKCVLHSANTTLCTGRAVNQELRCTGGEVFLVFLPVGLNWGYLTLVQAVMAGARAVLMERFSGSAALDLIQAERVTFVVGAPASLVAMLNSSALPWRDLSSLRVVVTGGYPAAVETLTAFQAAVPSACLVELYGMLETGFHTFTRLADAPERVRGTVGRCAPGMDLRILDDLGRDVPFGEEGEIAAAGPSIHLGYLGNEAANSASFLPDGWFRTGDLGRFADAEGNVRIVGRKKELIMRGGKKVCPREVEELLYQHPKLLAVAVVGVPDVRLGERICMCAIPKAGASLELAEFVAFLKGRIADYKLPSQLVVMDDFPMTPTGKVIRSELVKRVSQRARARRGAAAAATGPGENR